MIAAQAELKKSSDACSWGTSCLSPPFMSALVFGSGLFYALWPRKNLCRALDRISEHLKHLPECEREQLVVLKVRSVHAKSIRAILRHEARAGQEPTPPGSKDNY
jgi:hypothetical protein